MIGPSIQTLRSRLPSAIQIKLDLRVAGGGRCGGGPRPLGDCNAAMRDLDLGDEEILQLLEQRALIGFNIAVKPAGRRRTSTGGKSFNSFFPPRRSQSCRTP